MSPKSRPHKPRLHKPRLKPYRVLAALLYGSFESLLKPGQGIVVVVTGPFSRAIGTTTARVGEYLRWLERALLLRILEESRGRITVQLEKPDVF